MPDVVVITGPTATGKTALGARLAAELNGEVVSADSMQIYKHMDIGTAKPAAVEMLGVPHFMIDIVSPLESYSAARYVRDAALCIDDILQRGKLPVLVGGTGFYIDSLLTGRGFSARAVPGLRRDLEKEYDDTGGEAMLLKLKDFDPDSALKLHANDKKRIVRAFEVYMTGGKAISVHDTETQALPARYSALKFALTYRERAVLYSKINERVDDMMRRGLEAEVRTLLDMGAAPETTAMQAIGYKEIVKIFNGEYDMAAAVEMIKMQSRRYAKRQLTWLRRDTEVNWIYWTDAPDIAEGLFRIRGCFET